MSGNTHWWKKFKLTRKRILVLILVGISIVSLGVSFAQLGDLNTINNVPNQNADGHFIYNGFNMVLGISRIHNATIADQAHIDLWLNTTYFNNVTMITFVYYNGTQRDSEQDQKVAPEGHPNWEWWTNDIYIPIYLYENKTNIEYHRIYTWDDSANTSIEYGFFFRTKNGTDVSYIWLGGNFTIRYSELDNIEYQETHTLYWQTVALSSFLLIMIFFLIEFLRTPRDLMGIEAIANEIPIPNDLGTYATVGFFAQRADSLESSIGSLRTASEVLLGLGIGLLFFSFTPGFPSFGYYLVGLIMLIFACLASLAVSLSDSIIHHDMGSIDDAMLPSSDTDEGSALLIRMGIAIRIKIVSTMRFLLQAGVFAIVIFFLADLVLLWTIMYVNLLLTGQFADFWTWIFGAGITPIFVTAIILFVPFAFRLYGVPYFSGFS